MESKQVEAKPRQFRDPLLGDFSSIFSSSGF